MATPPPPYPHQPAGPYPGHAPQAPYVPQAPYAPASAQAPYALTPEQGAYGCRVCGSLPVADTTVYGHQGLVVLMRFRSRKGPFCRDCGVATVREMSARPLWQGWWSPLSVVIAPITLLVNLGPWGKLCRLGPPTGGVMAPLDPGRSLWLRPPALAFLVPLVLAVLAIPTLILVSTLNGDDEEAVLQVGQCVRNEGDWKNQALVVTDCKAGFAQYEVTGHLDHTGARCADGEYITHLRERPDGPASSCLRPLPLRP
ncbi:LppU/SCO3897 family protein [Streptomyces subrutilus]|uniref:LppU/SCO3897 family protein n=1 Tax=Streptomyces subrutilus TaxID=36818 RepID=UPI000ACB7F72|nr:hypothetical protein [Streptomyces subrutilus]